MAFREQALNNSPDAQATPLGPAASGSPASTAPAGHGVAGPAPACAPDGSAGAGAQGELSARALLSGCVLGALLAAANVYTGLKTAFIDGGNITASILGFALFAAVRSRRPYSVLENNMTQTVAASAAVMSMVVGVTGPIPALALGGHTFAPLAVCAWGLALGALGIAIAAVLRARLIEADHLPFPTGTATAEVIQAMARAGGSGLRRARALALAAAFAAAVTFLRDGSRPLLPQEILIPGAIAGVSAASLSLGISVSPMMVSTGLLVGLRGGLSMLLGSVLAWVVIAPQLVHRGIVTLSDRGPLVNWLMWPGAALMLSSSITSLLMNWRSMGRGLAELRSLGRRRSEAPRSEAAPLLVVTFLSVAGLLALGSMVFGLSPVTVVLALGLSFVLSVVCARSAGETDLAPVGSMGGVTQIVFGASSSVASLACGSIVAGNASQTAATLWALKAGQRLGGNPRSQIFGQLLGALVGAVVTVPTYTVVARAYGIGTEKMPAPGALSWKATADAVHGGLAALPPHAPSAALLALVIGTAFTALGETRVGRFLPSPVALGIAFLLPASLTAAIALGAVTLAVLSRARPTWTEEYVASVAGGAIAGESLLAVVLAALMCTGVLSN